MLDSEIYQLFPTGVMRFNASNIATEEQMNDFLNQGRTANSHNEVSQNNYILNNEKFDNIKVFLTNCVNQYLQEIVVPQNSVELYITQSWLNFSKKEQSHHVHRHPNSYLSGVFYIQSGESDKIVFHDTIKEFRSLDLPVKEFNLFNSITWWMPATESTVLVFPSHLVHSVPPVEEDKERISLAFNTFFKGYVGDESSLTGLRL